MKSFLTKLFLFSLLVSILDYCWIRFATVPKHIPHVWLLIAFFVAATALFHFLIMSSAKGKPENFFRAFIAGTGLRLLAYLLVIIAYGFFDKTTLLRFAIGFMVHYFLFTVFEVSTLLKELRRK